MSALYESCGGCGAETPSERCIGCLHDFGSGLTAPSNANTSGLIAEIDAEMEGRQRGYADVRGELLFRCRDALVTAASAQARIAELEALVASIRRAQRDVVRAEIEQEGYAPISDANDRATAAEARADRLAKALEPFAVPHECDGHATVENFNMEVQIFVRWSVIKAARAALQQETQK